MKTPKGPDQHPVFKNLADNHTKITKQLEGFIEYWIPALGLGDWKIDVDYTANNSTGGTPLASINPLWEYKAAHLEFFLPQLASHSANYLEFVVVHELCHPLVAQMRTKKSRIKDEESVVTHLAKAFLRVKYDPYYENPTKIKGKLKK